MEKQFILNMSLLLQWQKLHVHNLIYQTEFSIDLNSPDLFGEVIELQVFLPFIRTKLDTWRRKD